jgi:hypothetical protein
VLATFIVKCVRETAKTKTSAYSIDSIPELYVNYVYT